MAKWSGRLELVLLATLLVAATPAVARDGVVTRRHAANRTSTPLSVGTPTAGQLAGAVELRQSESLALKRTDGPRFGLPELVKMIERGARRVASKHPGSRLLVGDLSARRGGEIGGHRSHESGRDVDLGFYFTDRAGRSFAPTRFLAVDAEGRAVGAPQLRFDLRRNWALVESLLTDPGARVLHVFVAAPLRERLLAYARERDAYRPLFVRAALALRQPSDGLSHDDHFHVRIACPRAQRATCADEPPRVRGRVARK
jgi:penicillin-insensitive murein DD-endopeptidase